MAKQAVVVFFNLLSISLWMISAASAFEFRVGGPRGWVKPTGEESETYNHWARRNRFHIGDSLYFKYSNDSVLVVDREDYANCNTTNPLLKFTDGNTTFWFDRHGYYYFVSGEQKHCESGQKLIVRVMVHPFVNPGPGPAPFPMPGGGSDPDSGEGSRSRSRSHSGPSGAPWASSASALKVAAVSYSGVLVAGLGFGLVVLMFV